MKARLSIALLRVWLRWARHDRKAASALMSRAAAIGDWSTARSACEALLSADPPDPDALGRLADVYMGDGKPEAAYELYVRHAERVNSPLKPMLYKNAHMDSARAAAKEPYVHTLRDVTLETERCAIFDGEKVYIQETSGTNLENHPHLKVRATPDRAFFVISCPEPTQVIEEPCVLIGTDGGSNYSHWLTRNVFKLALLDSARVSTSLPLLINEDLRRYQIELISMLEIPQSRLMRTRRGSVIRCREITVPVNMRDHPKMRTAIDWLRMRLARFMEPGESARDLLYISRRDSQRHVLLNEMELDEALARLGFKTVVLSEMSFADQVHRFSRARIIVGAHGAGLTNIIFSPPHASVVEITNPNLRHMGDFRIMCKRMGMRYVEVLSNRFSALQTTAFAPDYDYYVDTHVVLERVREITDGLPAAR